MSRNTNVSLFVIAAYIAALFAMMLVPFPTVQASNTAYSKEGRIFWGVVASIYKPEIGQPEVHCMGSALVANNTFVWYCIVPPTEGNNNNIVDNVKTPAEGCTENCDTSTDTTPPTPSVVPPVVVIVPPVVVVVPPVVVIVPPVVIEDDAKVQCNNGEGNGSEGCSPGKGSGANNDENNTSPSEDKSKGKNK